MLAILKSLWKDEDGATAVEYGIMVALIAIVIILAVQLLGQRLSTTFNNAQSQMATG